MFCFPRALPHIRWGPQPGNRDTESTRGLSAIWGDFVSSNFQSEKFLASTKTQYLKMIILRDCRVVRDPQTLKSKGYGFVSFMKKVRKEYRTILTPFSKELHPRSQENQKKRKEKRERNEISRWKQRTRLP